MRFHTTILQGDKTATGIRVRRLPFAASGFSHQSPVISHQSAVAGHQTQSSDSVIRRGADDPTDDQRLTTDDRGLTTDD